MDNHRLLTVIKVYLMAKGYEVYCDHNPHFFIAAIFGGHHEVNFIDQSGKIELWIDARLAFRNADDTKVTAVMTGESAVVRESARRREGSKDEPAKKQRRATTAWLRVEGRSSRSS